MLVNLSPGTFSLFKDHLVPGKSFAIQIMGMPKNCYITVFILFVVLVLNQAKNINNIKS